MNSTAAAIPAVNDVSDPDRTGGTARRTGNAFIALLDRVKDDTGYGVLMFYAFAAAVLLISGAIAALAFVTQWWMLGVVVAVHMAITAVVSCIVFHAFDVPAPADVEEAANPAV